MFSCVSPNSIASTGVDFCSLHNTLYKSTTNRSNRVVGFTSFYQSIFITPKRSTLKPERLRRQWVTASAFHEDEGRRLAKTLWYMIHGRQTPVHKNLIETDSCAHPFWEYRNDVTTAGCKAVEYTADSTKQHPISYTAYSEFSVHRQTIADVDLSK